MNSEFELEEKRGRRGLNADESRGTNVGVGDMEDTEEVDDNGCPFGCFSCQRLPLA